MDIIDEIETVLASYKNATGIERPTRLRLGRTQLQAFDSKYLPFASRAASPGPHRAYDGIPIVATEAQDELEAE
jgi:hypothetical protein